MADKKNDPAAPTAVLDPLAELDSWWRSHIPNSRFSADTAAYNRIKRQFDGLRAALAAVKE